MGSVVVLLRGINLGSANRVAMPALRDALAEAGFGAVRTYVQSGNLVLDSELEPGELTDRVSRVLVDRFGVDVAVVARTAAEFADVVARNPFVEESAINPKALQVTFRGEDVTPEVLTALEARAAASEKVAAVGREIYSWHPDGIARSKLALAITPRASAATARNWKTVTTLLEMTANDAR
jgi:uncharacterized protein (DUF1697 family)